MRKRDSKASTWTMKRAAFRLLRQLLSKVPGENVFEGTGVHQCWALWKHHLLRAQEQAMPKCQKPSRRGGRPACLDRHLLWERGWKKELCAPWNPGQEKNTQMLLATVGRNLVWRKRSGTRRWPEMWGTIGRVVLNTLFGEKNQQTNHCRNNIVPFQDVDGHLRNTDRDTAKVFKVHSLPLSSTLIPPVPVENIALEYQGTLLQSP